MIAPAANAWPPALNGASAAAIFTVGFLNRKLTSVLSLLFSTITVFPEPLMPPAATTSFFIGTIVIGWFRMRLPAAASTLVSRLSGPVHPVSSYGGGVAGG